MPAKWPPSAVTTACECVRRALKKGKEKKMKQVGPNLVVGGPCRKCGCVKSHRRLCKYYEHSAAYFMRCHYISSPIENGETPDAECEADAPDARGSPADAP